MSDTLTSPDADIFNSIFSSEGDETWVLIKCLNGGNHKAIGPFSSKEEAESFREHRFPDYIAIEVRDPEDMIIEGNA